MSSIRTLTPPALGLAALTLLAACGGGSQPPGRAAVEFKGTDPAASSGTSVQARSGGAEIVTYDGYQAAVAQSGDTVASVANRINLSPSELGAYNGLPADYQLRAGDELVLPPRQGGYGGAPAPATRLAEAPSTTGTTASGGFDSGSFDSAGTAATGDPWQPIEAAPLESAPTAAAGPTGTATSGTATFGAGTTGDTGGWSPEVAALAIERAASGEGQTGARVPPPPSAGAPLPPDPEPAPELASPQLGQYQTPGGGTGRVPAPRPVETITTPAEQPPQEVIEEPAQQPVQQPTQLASAPAASGDLGLIRPVRGPIVTGFQQGSGRMRNDGVDFAAPVGAPVLAAADGEVALVSQSLGGLGTILLVRHAGDYLTVYGRIDRVTVRKGDLVTQGQEIGVVAQNADPRMHFEVRKGAESLDPERFFAGTG